MAQSAATPTNSERKHLDGNVYWTEQLHLGVSTPLPR